MIKRKELSTEFPKYLAQFHSPQLEYFHFDLITPTTMINSLINNPFDCGGNGNRRKSDSEHSTK